METANENDVNTIAKNALTEFFFPVLKLSSFIKNISSAITQNKEIIIKINNIENLISENIKTQSEYADIYKKFNKSIYSQTKLLNNLNDDFSEVKKFIGRESLLSKSLEDYSHSVTSHISVIVNKLSDLKTRELVSGGALTTTAAEIGLANIEYILNGIIKNERETPYLFGINKGGAFLANYLAHRIGLHEKYLVKCDYRREYDKIYCEERETDGTIVIIDDVTRTGKTLRKVKDYLQNRHPKSNIFSIVLVMSCKEKQDYNDAYEVVDYSPWITSHQTVSLPWSKNSSDLLDSEEYFSDVEMDQIVGRLKYDNPT